MRATGSASEVHLIGGAVLDEVCVRGVVIPDGQIGGFSGALTNSGVLAVAPSGGQSTLFAPAVEGGFLIGDGGMDDCVRLGGQTTARLGDFGGFFQNAANHRIDGAGVVFGGFENRGVIEAKAGANGQLIITLPGRKLNAGVLAARGSGILRLIDVVSQSHTGRIESQDGGLILVAANVTGTGGMRTVGGMIRFENVSVQLANCIQTCPPHDPAVAGGIEILGSTITANTPRAPNDLDMAGGVVSLALSSTVTLAGPVRLCPPPGKTAALTINDSAFSCGDWFQCEGGSYRLRWGRSLLTAISCLRIRRVVRSAATGVHRCG